MAGVFLHVLFLKPTEVNGKSYLSMYPRKLDHSLSLQYWFRQSLLCMLMQSLEDSMAYNFSASLEPQERWLSLKRENQERKKMAWQFHLSKLGSVG